MIVFELVEGVEYFQGIFQFMNSYLWSNGADVMRFKVGIPEVKFYLGRIIVLGKIECFDDLDGFHISEGKILAFHLFNKKLKEIFSPIDDATIKTSENGSKTKLSSVSSNVGLKSWPGCMIEIASFGEIVEKQSYILRWKWGIFALEKILIKKKQLISFEPCHM